jgi:hypothetical protein
VAEIIHKKESSLFVHLWIYLLNYFLLTSWKRVFFWKDNRCPANQDIPRNLWNPKVYYRIYKYQSPVPILRQINPVHASPSHLLKIHLNIIFSSTPDSYQWSLSFRFPTRTLHTPLLALTCYMPHPSHVTNLHLLIFLSYGLERLNTWCSSLITNASFQISLVLGEQRDCV